MEVYVVCATALLGPITTNIHGGLASYSRLQIYDVIIGNNMLSFLYNNIVTCDTVCIKFAVNQM